MGSGRIAALQSAAYEPRLSVVSDFLGKDRRVPHACARGRLGRCHKVRDEVTAMRLRIPGCSGGIGGRHLRTTSMLLDYDVLIDAGTGVGDLSLTELSLADHIFVTH